MSYFDFFFFFFQAEDGIRDWSVTEFRRVLFRSISHDREKCLTEPLQHCGFGFALQRRFRCGARVERDVSARQNGLDVREPRRFERLLQLGHLRVHRADPTEKRGIAWHEMKATETSSVGVK